MASQALSHVFGVAASLTGRAWHWRGGNMQLGAQQQLGDDIVRQLLLSRGVAPDDIERHRVPTLRNFLPDPSRFRDMDVAADRLAQARRVVNHTSSPQSKPSWRTYRMCR